MKSLTLAPRWLGNVALAGVLVALGPAHSDAENAPGLVFVGQQEGRSVAVTGYGPWQFGMSLEEVTAVEAHAPYEPVYASMGGVETLSGPLEEGVEKISFVFNSADELYDIRVWYDTGDGYDAAVAAFHRAYLFVEERFGPVRAESGFRLDEGMPLEEFAALMPEHFAPVGDEVDFETYLKENGSVEINQQRLMMGPEAALHDAAVSVVYLSVKPTTMRAVTLFYRGIQYVE